MILFIVFYLNFHAQVFELIEVSKLIDTNLVKKKKNKETRAPEAALHPQSSMPTMPTLLSRAAHGSRPLFTNKVTVNFTVVAFGNLFYNKARVGPRTMKRSGSQ